MTKAERILNDQFKEIAHANLILCSNAYELLDSHRVLQRQRTVFWATSLVILAILAALGFLVFWFQLGWVWMALVGGVAAVSLLFLWRQNRRLGRALHEVRQRCEQTRLLGRSRQIVQLVVEVARKVIEYNQLIDRLETLQTGDFWRDFRQLSDAEKSYIEATFFQVRGQLLAALQVCRQLLDNPKAKVAGSLSHQLVSRDQAMVHEFTAKTMTSNQYLKLAQDLTQMESDLQEQLAAYR